MFGSSPFFKREVTDMRARPAVIKQHQGARPIEGHPRFGFHTMLNTHSSGVLPTAPAIVGGNVNWKKSTVTPLTNQLHSILSDMRGMRPAPALGSFLGVTEPTINSIHTTY
jgi:hypothetical protein